MSVLTWTIRHAMAAPNRFARIRTTGVSYSIESDGSVSLTFSSSHEARKLLEAICAACADLGGDNVA